MQGKGPDRVGKGANDGAKDEEGDMLKEVNLATLGVVEVEPVGVGEFLGIVAIAGVWVAELGGVLLTGEGLAVDLVELLHEFSVENLDASAHGDGVDSDEVLDDDGHGKDEAPEHLLGDLIVALRDANDLHLSFGFY